MTFETRVQGIPCTVVITLYEPGTSRLITSASLEPNDPEELEFVLHDRKGYRARWLEDKLTEADEERIYHEFHDIRRADNEP